MKKKLTAVAVASLPPGIYTDAACAGLTLRVGVKRRTWSVFHRVGGRLTQTTIGHFPTMGLADARKAAGTLAERIEAGAPPEPPAPHPRAAVLTLGGLIDRYERHRRRKGGRGMKSLDEALRTVRRGLADYLKLPAVQFSKADLRAARDVIAARAPTAANRFQAYLGPGARLGRLPRISSRTISAAPSSASDARSSATACLTATRSPPSGAPATSSATAVRRRTSAAWSAS